MTRPGPLGLTETHLGGLCCMSGMSMITVSSAVESASISAMVTRCTCGNPSLHIPDPCPGGRAEDHGVIAYYHKNPLRRLLWWMRKRSK